jgi:hypothetical protein
MTTRYPPPPVRPRVTPGRGVPMRQWASASYDPSNGRAAAATRGPNPGSYTTLGEHCSPNAQAVREDSGFQARDRRATQNSQPVRLRKIG